MRSASSYNDYLSQHPKWHDDIELLRKVLLEIGLKESIKWGAPVYGFKKHNVVSIAAFKNHLALWIFQGSLLKDKKELLIVVQEQTKAMRHLRYHHNDEIDVEIVREYCLESIENFKLGKIIKADRSKKELVMPAFFSIALVNDPSLANAFNKLTDGKKREYAEYIATAKQEKTKLARLEKIRPLIIEGLGLNDAYR